MNSTDTEIKKVKVKSVKCPGCKLTVKVKPSEKKCPKCKYPLDRPSPEVIEKLRTLYRQREHNNRALDRMLAKHEREQYATALDKVLAQISELLMKQETYKKWFDGDGKGPLPGWVYEVTGGRPVKPQKP
jgi:hypothetical protein